MPADLAAAHAMILTERAAKLAAEAKLAEAGNAQAKQASTDALIAQHEIEKLRRTLMKRARNRKPLGRSIQLLHQ